MIGLRRIVPAVLVGAALALAASPALAGFSGTDLFLPSVGNRPGNSGSQWHTLLWIHNPTASNLTVRVYFLARNAANPAPPYFDDLVPAGGTVRYPDVITDRFHLSAWGALRITAPAPVLATCRMYNLPSGGADCDTQGQDYVGVPAPFAIGAGRSTQLLGVYQTTPLASSMFRYSFGWVETSGGTVNVRVSAYGEDGSLVAVKDYPTTQGYEARYYDISDLIPNVNETNVRLTVEATGGAGRIVAVGSGVANSSNDGTTFEMRFPDSLLAAGLSAVIHDATLTGDGTAATPLGIANGGVGSPQLASGAVTGQKVAAGAIGTDHLANGAVTKPKLAATGGTNGQVLGTDGSALTWQTPSGFTLPYSGVKNNNADPLFYIVNTGTGPGVRSESSGGAGLYAYSANGAEGVYGASDRSNGYGVLGVAHNGASSAGVYGEGAGGAGVWGTAGTGWGVHGQSATGIGVDGNGGATGVKGVGVNAGAYGVWGIANNGAGAVGVFGMSSAGDALYGASDSGAGAIVTSTSGPGLSAQSGSGVAVDAYSTGSIGVRAECAKPGGTGISAMASGTNAKGVYSSVTGSGAIGVFGGSSDSTGVEGSSGSGTGVSGVSNGTAVFGQSTGGANGVWGFTNSATSAGVRGENSNGYGVVGVSGAGFGVSGYGNSIGIYAHNSYVGGDDVYLATRVLAIDAYGDVNVRGNLAKTTGSFKIDHPLDPANKYLLHSFVESPDMMNVYNGNVVTDAEGAAVVVLPDYFEALNRDFRYQLTVIGRFAQAIVEREIEGNRFTIRTNLANVKVSWQVTGIRKDPYAEAHRIQVEVDKPEGERGFFLYPELYGQPAERAIQWARYGESPRHTEVVQGAPATDH